MSNILIKNTDEEIEIFEKSLSTDRLQPRASAFPRDF
jgi:hypothetical protein